MLSKVSLQLDSHNQNHSYSVCILRHSFNFVFFMLCSSYANHPPVEPCVIPLFPGTGHTQQRSLTLKAATSAAYVSLSACTWHTLCLYLAVKCWYLIIKVSWLCKAWKFKALIIYNMLLSSNKTSGFMQPFVLTDVDLGSLMWDQVH